MQINKPPWPARSLKFRICSSRATTTHPNPNDRDRTTNAAVAPILRSAVPHPRLNESRVIDHDCWGFGVPAREDPHPSQLQGHKALCPCHSLINLSSPTAIVARAAFAWEEQILNLWKTAGCRDSIVCLGRTAGRKCGATAFWSRSDFGPRPRSCRFGFCTWAFLPQACGTC